MRATTAAIAQLRVASTSGEWMMENVMSGLEAGSFHPRHRGQEDASLGQGTLRARRLLELAFPTLILALGPLPALLADSHQYTWSLAIFALPAMLLLLWLMRSPEPWRSTNMRSIGVSIAVLLPLALILDFLLGDDFFRFQNRDAVMGVYLPTFDLFQVDADQGIPIEELAFFVWGFLFILLTYTWGDRTLYGSRVHRPRSRTARWLLLPTLLPVLGVTLWAAQALDMLHAAPGYLIYLLVVPSGMAAVLLPRVAHRTNWRAFGYTTGTLLCICIVWEVGLAVPDGWWGYRPEAMLGIYLGPNLPVEAPVVWLVAPLTSVLVFEEVRARCTMLSR